MAQILFKCESTVESIIRDIATTYKLNYAEMYQRYVSGRVFSKVIMTRSLSSIAESNSMVYKKMRLAHCSMMSGSDFTKETRTLVMGDVSKGSGTMRPEMYQREQIILRTGVPCDKTHMRINWKMNQLVEKIHPMRYDDGFNYSENFDGVQILPNGLGTVYVNLKNVCGKGGSQMRTLRHQTYHFVDSQINVLKKAGEPCGGVFFANVLDGDEAAECMRFFDHLLLGESDDIREKVYVGDLRGYIEWFARKCNSQRA